MPSAVGLRRSLGSAVQKLGTKLSVFCLLGGEAAVLPLGVIFLRPNNKETDKQH